MAENFSVITTTYTDKESAKKTAKLLIEQHLAACVQLFPIESIYSWKGEICQDAEILLIIKSRTVLFDEITAVIKENHPYEVPQIIQVPVTNGLPDYLKWIAENTKERTSI